MVEAGTEVIPGLIFKAKVALAVTDHDWVIEHVSRDVEEILGHNPDTYKGSSLLGLLQPGDVQGFILAVSRAIAARGRVTLRTRLRADNDTWRDVWCLVAAMCQDPPPRLGLAIAPIPEPENGLTSELHRKLALHGDGAFGDMGQRRWRLSSGSFSKRQLEILVRLVRGEPVHEIADALYLSPSTVRNHLTSIYKKCGVHSQAGLLAKVLEALG
jgi:DNA-binding CsgD family transcriptional regulator